MRKLVWILAIVILVLVIVLVTLLLTRRKPDILDGPGMIYEWTSYELYGDWVEVDPSANRNPERLKIEEGKLTFTGSDGRKETYRCTLPDSADSEGRPEGEVYLRVENCPEYSDFIFHEEQTDSKPLLPVISCTIFEFDGRGEIVISEFVRIEDAGSLPEGFRSSARIRRNDREAPPTFMEVEPDSSEEPGLSDESEPAEATNGSESFSSPDHAE